MLQRLGVPVERILPSETAGGRIDPVDVGETTIKLEGLQSCYASNLKLVGKRPATGNCASRTSRFLSYKYPHTQP